ncbi:MAG: 50S ribosomal protein L6 [Candidatus Doudnabacteria bacterium]|nr:50S ribosomal protein L6 [Candidatus Doudnabacteria bacterium]
MSKIGKKQINIPLGVEISVNGLLVQIKGPKGELQVRLHPKVSVSVADGAASVAVKNPEDKRQRALWGTFRSLLSGAVAGVTEGFTKRLAIQGVGYKAALAGDKLTLHLGYSHPIELVIPKGLAVTIEKNIIVITGIDKQMVGQFAAVVRSRRPPEPYKGKGVRYEDEVVRRKAGKVVKAVGG